MAWCYDGSWYYMIYIVNNTVHNETEKILNSINIVRMLSCEVSPGIVREQGIQLVTANKITGLFIQEWYETFIC